MENLIGQMAHVVVSKDGKKGTKFLKVCKVKARSILFIEIDKQNRKNIFRKVAKKDITPIGLIGESPAFSIKDGVLPEKWESSWDSMGSYSPSVRSYGRFAQAARPSLTNYSNYMKPSTTNSSVGFPMV
ncbi:MAG: hypothetical protein RL621_1813 [Bacteroidota bacterium]